MADQRQDSRSGRVPKPRLNVQGASTSDPEIEGDKFKVKIALTVLYGNRPAQGATCQFVAGGQNLTDAEPVEPDGNIEVEVKLGGEKALVYARLVRGGEQELVFVKKIPLPKPKRSILVLQPFLERRDTQGNLVEVQVYLRRVGVNGKPEMGRINYFDFGPARNWDLWHTDVDPAKEVAIATLPVLEQPRSVEFFLPDDKDVRTSVSLPGKEEVVDVELTTPTSTKDPFLEGRNLFRKWAGKTPLPNKEG